MKKAKYTLVDAADTQSSENVVGKHIISLEERELYDNTSLATLVAIEVSEAVPKSTNALESGRVCISRPTLYKRGNKRSATYNICSIPHRADGRKLDAQRLHMEKVSNWADYFGVTDRLCRASGVGNCMELATMACKRLKDRNAQYVDYVAITDGVTGNAVIPHGVAVLGRKDSNVYPEIAFSRSLAAIANIGLPDTWNSSAVICDPWARNAYPAKNYDQFWDIAKLYSLSPQALSCYLLYRFPY